jgi:agmatine/peptidylarginine deiminase
MRDEQWMILPSDDETWKHQVTKALSCITTLLSGLARGGPKLTKGLD